MNARPKVLVAEKIGDSGIALLQEHFDVDLGAGCGEHSSALAVNAAGVVRS